MQTYEIVTTTTVEVDDEVTETDIYRILNNEGRERWLADYSIARDDHVQEGW